MKCSCYNPSAVISPRVTWVNQVELGLAHHHPGCTLKIIDKRGQITKHRADHLPLRQLTFPSEYWGISTQICTWLDQPKFVPELTQVDTSVKLVLALDHSHNNISQGEDNFRLAMIEKVQKKISIL